MFARRPREVLILCSSFWSIKFCRNCSLNRIPAKETLLNKTTVLKSYVCFNNLPDSKSFATNISKVCRKCNKALKFPLVCPMCNCLQKVSKIDDCFELLGLERNYEVNMSDLKKNYLQLQSLLHPDKFSTSTDETDKILSNQYSSLINKAYKTMVDPIQRGIHLLMLNNFTDSTKMDADFLTEMMSFNEELEVTKCSKKLKELELLNKNKFISTQRIVAEAFKLKNFILAHKSISKMKFYDSNIDRIKQMKSERSIID